MRLVFIAVLLMVVLGLSYVGLRNLQPAEERAQAIYEDGLARMQAGDLDRASVQFREAARLDDDFVAPRLAYAQLLRAQNRFEPAAALLIETLQIDPANGPANLEYAELLFLGGVQDVAREKLDAAAAALGETPRVLALDAALLLVAGDLAGAEAQALAALDRAPDLSSAYATLGAVALQRNDRETAFAILDRARDVGAEDRALAVLRLALLEQYGEWDAVGVELVHLVATFPDEYRFALALADWHASLDPPDTAAAEAVLRRIAEEYAGNTEVMGNVLRRFVDLRGLEQTRRVLTELSEAAGDGDGFARELAALDYAGGDPDAAIARLEAAVAAGNDTDERNAARLLMAQMLDRLDDAERRKAIATEVLSEDPENYTAYLVRAESYLAEGETQKAIVDLRAALNADPRSVDVITRLAMAHYMDGSSALALDRLSKAAQLSEYAPGPTLTLARFQMAQGNDEAARTVLDRALARPDAPPALLLTRAGLALDAGDLNTARQMATRLAAFPDFADRVTDLQAAILAQGGGAAAAITLLEENWQRQQTDQAMLALGAGYLRQGRAADAIALADGVLASNPDDVSALLLSADAHLAEGTVDRVQDLLMRAAALSDTADPAVSLVQFQLSRGAVAQAGEAIAAALAAHPDDPRLITLDGVLAEIAGDPERAIARYGDAHDLAPLDGGIANALATLLLDYRDDADSHARALVVARRLEGASDPARSGTFGWALFRTGEADAAFDHLRAAADRLPDDPLAQMRYGLILAETGQPSAARERLDRGLSQAEGTPYATGPLAEEARTVRAALPEDRKT